MPVNEEAATAISAELDQIDNAVLRIHDLIVVDVPPPPPPPPPLSPLDELLESLLPADGPVVPLLWGQAFDASKVAPGTRLVLPPGEAHGGDYIINGLKGTSDNWIRIVGHGFTARDVATWRGLGIYGCEYVHVDGLSFVGRGDDYAAGVECVGGHHVAVTRTTSTNTGGHAVAGSWSPNLGYDRSPANLFIGWNTAIETSRRNPYNGSAFSIWHAATGKPWGPLAQLGYTDYVIGNVAFGCESLVKDPSWGVTDGNCFIADRGGDVGYAGKMLVAFGVGADNGGRGFHALSTANVHSLFQTMVGNQRTLESPVGGEFSQHAVSGGGMVRGNIAAATTRQPATWYQDFWLTPDSALTIDENVVLAGTARAPYDVPVNPDGLAYLVGATTTSRNLDDYRPHAGTPLVDADLRALFAAVSKAFPGADGAWRREAIVGALDT